MSVSEWRADDARKMAQRVYSLTLVATGKIVAMSVSEWSGGRRAQDGTAGLLAHARSYGEDRSHERERMEGGRRA